MSVILQFIEPFIYVSRVTEYNPETGVLYPSETQNILFVTSYKLALWPTNPPPPSNAYVGLKSKCDHKNER